MEECVACGRSGRPLTREHVFARWLVRRLRGGRLVAGQPSARRTEGVAAERIGRVVTSVCADCNAGWMSVLEVSFDRALFGRPRVGPIQEADRVTLSRWFTKTAVLLAHARDSALVSAAHRAQLVAGMPDDLEVFVARRRRPPQRLDFALDVTAEDPARVRSIAILVDDLVGRVAPRGALSSRHGTRLWPLRSHALRWETLPVITSYDG